MTVSIKAVVRDFVKSQGFFHHVVQDCFVSTDSSLLLLLLFCLFRCCCCCLLSPTEEGGNGRVKGGGGGGRIEFAMIYPDKFLKKSRSIVSSRDHYNSYKCSKLVRAESHPSHQTSPPPSPPYPYLHHHYTDTHTTRNFNAWLRLHSFQKKSVL